MGYLHGHGSRHGWMHGRPAGQNESSDGDTGGGSFQISNTCCCHLRAWIGSDGGVEVEAYAVIQSAPAAAAVLPCCCLAGADGGQQPTCCLRGPLLSGSAVHRLNSPDTSARPATATPDPVQYARQNRTGRRVRNGQSPSIRAQFQLSSFFCFWNEERILLFSSNCSTYSSS